MKEFTKRKNQEHDALFKMSARKKLWKRSAFSLLASEDSLLNEKQHKLSNPEKLCDLEVDEEEKCEPIACVSHDTTNLPTQVTSPPDNWIESFAPTTLNDLAIHGKKIADLQTWFAHCNEGHKKQPAQLCLLNGPSGAGKTAAIRVLAAVHGYQLHEWINPLDQEVVTMLGDQSDGNSYVGSQVEAFKAFLLRASRYRSLLQIQDKRLLLVEDFPNALIRDAATFEGILEDYINYGKSPLIFIVADSKSRDLNINYNLFSEQVKSRFKINQISLNPIAATLMQKAMKRFCAIMRTYHATTYKVPAQTIIDSIVVCAQGDIRNALLNLHFSSLRGAPSMLTKAVVAAKKQNQSSHQKKQSSTLRSVGRDESITMLHALGRVFNPKYINECDGNKLMHNPEALAEAFSTEPKNFINFIHANYLPHFKEIEHVPLASDGLSLADRLLCEYREDALAVTAISIGTRSVMVANAAPVTGWMPVHGPKRLKSERDSPMPANITGQNISVGLYASEYRTYVQCILQAKQQ